MRARKAVGDAGPAAGQAAALLRPPAVRRGQRRRGARRHAPGCPRSTPATRPAGVHRALRAGGRRRRGRPAGRGRAPLLAAGRRGRAAGRGGELGAVEHDVVWQSRSGPPQVPWLEPDVVDHLDALHAQGVPAVVVAPIGFVSDHVEVVWDLDHEARERAAELGMGFARAATAGPGPAVRRHGGGADRRARSTTSPRAALGEVPRAGVHAQRRPVRGRCCEPARRAPRPRAGRLALDARGGASSGWGSGGAV